MRLPALVVLSLLLAESVPAATPPNGTEIWEFPVTLTSAAPAIGEDGTIYIGPFAGGQPFYALNPDGSLKWAYRALTQGNFQAPALGPDGTIYAECGERRTTFAFDPSGTVKWEANAFAADTPSVGLDGTVFIGDYFAGHVRALDTAGNPRWEFATGEQRSWSPSIGPDGTLYCVAGSLANGTGDVAVYSNRLFSLTSDGKKNWDIPLGFSITSPSVADNRDIFVVVENVLEAVSPSGTVHWQFQLDFSASFPPVVAADGTLYLGSRGGQFVALSSEGVEKWSFHTQNQEGISSCPAIMANGTVLFASDEGKVYAFSSEGQQLWQFTTSARFYGGSPALGRDGTIYIGNLTTLYALKNDSPLGQQGWAKFGRDARQSFSSFLPRFQQVSRQGDQLRAQVQSAGSSNLTIEGSADFRSWKSVTNIMGSQGGMTIANIPIPPDAASGFYRLRAATNATSSLSP